MDITDIDGQHEYRIRAMFVSKPGDLNPQRIIVRVISGKAPNLGEVMIKIVRKITDQERKENVIFSKCVIIKNEFSQAK